MNSFDSENKLKLDEDVVNFYMSQAIMYQAKISKEMKEVPVGCVFCDESLVKFKGEEAIVAKAHNLTNQTKNATQHCEIICVGLLGQVDYSKLILFVTCEPCIMCAYALELVGIKQIYFGCYNQRFGGNGSVLSIGEGQYRSYGGYCQDMCIKILQTFYDEGNLSINENLRHRKHKQNNQELQ